ncbi:Uncharacterized protein FWK35_00025726 [Aphis craccivora]|uniref:Uncharacterized protein n=1 Tax=Aphis craccivora TaxID=307492 RepID=A0A6G0YJF8_APHCR|nr:Uncharacterized protein FWK35_00025726 [Aphis craccivora]
MYKYIEIKNKALAIIFGMIDFHDPLALKCLYTLLLVRSLLEYTPSICDENNAGHTGKINKRYTLATIIYIGSSNDPINILMYLGNTETYLYLYKYIVNWKLSPTFTRLRLCVFRVLVYARCMRLFLSIEFSEHILIYSTDKKDRFHLAGNSRAAAAAAATRYNAKFLCESMRRFSIPNFKFVQCVVFELQRSVTNYKYKLWSKSLNKKKCIKLLFRFNLINQVLDLEL